MINPKQLFPATLISVFYTNFDNKWPAFSPPLTAFVIQASKNHNQYTETEIITKPKKRNYYA